MTRADRPRRDGTSERRPLTITCVRRDPEHGFWRARVTRDGVTLDVDRRDGSWLARHADGKRRREVLPDVARALQERVRPLERAEQREAAPA